MSIINKKSMFDKYDFGKKYEIDYGKLMGGLRDFNEEEDNTNSHFIDYLDYFKLIQNNFTDEPKETTEQAKMKNRNSKIDDLLK